jgi:hypothetical protein
MKTHSPLYHLNGDEPPVVGHTCTGLVLQHFYENGQITNQVNVAYLKFGAAWCRLYFECGTVFWRQGDEPGQPQNASLSHGLLLNDLQDMNTIVGQRLEHISYSGTEPGDLVVRLSFSNGHTVQFVYSAATDTAQFEVQPAGEARRVDA